MLKFTNLLWLYRKNAFITCLLLVVMIFFSIFANYNTVRDRLIGNNRGIAFSIQNILHQYGLRLGIYQKALELNPDISELDHSVFDTFYYLDKNGNVLANSSSEHIDKITKFQDITAAMVHDDFYFSQLETDKDYNSNIYIAKRLNNFERAEFLVAKLNLKTMLHDIGSFPMNFMLVDNYGNVIYSSDKNKVETLENINSFKFYWYLKGIYQTMALKDKTGIEETKGFTIRSFISIEEFINYYFLISAFLLVISILYIWNMALDRLFLKRGFIAQAEYCYDMLNANEIEKYQVCKSIEGGDLDELQKKLSENIIAYHDIKREYSELEQRLNSMFSKSTIPMLMIDAYTAKIFKANESALEFYNQKLTSISRMNLYMLGREYVEGRTKDPINFAGAMQNSIKHKGFYIHTEHYVGNGESKEVKLYPFVMRSEKFCYDILMILDTNQLSRSYENIRAQYNALENSFIVNMFLNIDKGKLRIRSFSKNIERTLGYASLPYVYFRDMLHSSSVQQYMVLMSKLREVKASGFADHKEALEQNLFIRQANGKYAEIRASFSVMRDFNYDFGHEKYLSIVAHFAIVRKEINEHEVIEPISFSELYSKSKALLAVFDKNFNVLTTNEELAIRLQIKEGKAYRLYDIINKDADKLIASIKTQNGGELEDVYHLHDSNGILHPVKVAYLVSENSLGEKVYSLLFKQFYNFTMLDNFIQYLGNKQGGLIELYCRFYYEDIERRIENNLCFCNLTLSELEKNLQMQFSDEDMVYINYMRELVAALNEKDREKIKEIYEQGKTIFRSNNE